MSEELYGREREMQDADFTPLTLCDVDGILIRDQFGAPMTAKIGESQTARQIAARLALRRFRAERGSDFDRPTSSLRFPRFVY